MPRCKGTEEWKGEADEKHYCDICSAILYCIVLCCIVLYCIV